MRFISREKRDYMADMGKRLNKVRKTKGVYVADIENDLRMDRSALYTYEKGRSVIPPYVLKRLADYYGVPVGFFFGEVDECKVRTKGGTVNIEMAPIILEPEGD